MLPVEGIHGKTVGGNEHRTVIHMGSARSCGMIARAVPDEVDRLPYAPSSQSPHEWQVRVAKVGARRPEVHKDIAKELVHLLSEPPHEAEGAFRPYR